MSDAASKAKAVVFLADGMADEALEELSFKTPLEAASTPAMDSIAAKGASGSFLTLPAGFPTSSDAANMSVLGYDLAQFYPGRGPIEAVSQDIALAYDDIAWRCNLVTVADGILKDYSAGHVSEADAAVFMNALKAGLDSAKATFHSGVSYRNLLVLHGREFSDKIDYAKPDSSQDEPVASLRLAPRDASKEALHTIEFLEDLSARAEKLLSAHPLNAGRKSPANWIWPWSPGHRPAFTPFSEKYQGRRGAVISAVDVIFGIAKCAKMDVIKVPGATGFVDTNYEGKAQAAVKAIESHELVYVHVEAIDECGHMGDLKLKMRAIEDFDSRIVAPVMKALEGQGVSFLILPDHPVPVKQRKHTRTPVPFAICGPHIKADAVSAYSETAAKNGSLGFLKGEALMRLALNI
jgi:2,3-bisphosphoglycerate-independent phosphoglycerate mutase